MVAAFTAIYAAPAFVACSIAPIGCAELGAELVDGAAGAGGAVRAGSGGIGAGATAATAIKSGQGPANSADDLMRALAASGAKHNPKNIVGTARDASVRVVFLETGNADAGLTHILERHSSDFVRAGVAESDIATLVVKAAWEGKVVGMQGAQGTRPIYEVMYNGQSVRLAVRVGSNGFIVGANPVG